MIAPTIIIGLGGIGSEICARVAKHSKNMPQSKRLKFVCVDTDVNDLRKRREENSDIITIQTSAPYVVSSYLENNDKAREDWFPVHNILRGKTPTEGAGQVRAISRLAFDEAIREGRLTALDKAIEELYYLDGSADLQAIRVIIVSTLAGGTGSGIVLPTALYVKHFLETRFKKSASVIRGFFLLPEIMFGSKSPEECGSLCCNAYASMRELDAFMRRGDGALDGPKYKDLKLELPEANSGHYMDYQVTPFNFCFLYDKRNTDDLQLKSVEDYKEHAANTIYAQAVSGISSKSNSNEDNTIKPLVESNGRNRFCGAGSSLLVYPRDSVLEYIAGNWCIENMDEEWLRVDKLYREHLADIKEQKKTNPNISPDEYKDFFIRYYSKPADGSFEKIIRDMIIRIGYDDAGNEEEFSKVDEYLRSLDDYITSIVDTDEVKERRSMFECQSNEEDAENQAFETKAQDMESTLLSYKEALFRSAYSQSRMIAQQLFKNTDDLTGTKDLYRLEGILKDEDKKFLHPNAVRLFIYMLMAEFQKNIDAEMKVQESFTPSLNPFDLEETERIENIYDHLDRVKKRRLLTMFKKSISNRDQSEIMGLLEDQFGAITKVGFSIAKQRILEEGLDYLSLLAQAFEEFYLNYPIYLQDTKKNVASISERYGNGEGKATRYVCSDEKCLNELLALMKCTGENANVNGNLSATIYQEIKTYALMTRKPNPGKFFQELFEDRIMGFWKDRVAGAYPSYLDMDIITALNAEVDFETSGELTSRERENQVVKILREAERLAAPFIEEPRGEQRHPFTICSYHPAVDNGRPERAGFVRTHLNDRLGGSPDPNISPYELLIYKAIYNMNAGDLMRFNAPKENNSTGGEYYNAYIDVISRLGPKTEKNQVISPHLDRKWHLPKFMPDLDDRNQSILENDIYKAMAWGLFTGVIEQDVTLDVPPVSRRSRKYVTYYPANSKSSEFIISNGTFCDELYEVVDGMSINLPQVRLILEDYHKLLKDEKDARKSLAESFLVHSLNWKNPKLALGDDFEPELIEMNEIDTFKLPQFLPKEMKPSIFDLLYWIKQSTPVEDFEENELSTILKSIIELVEEYVAQFIPREKLYNRCFGIFKDQFELFMDNLGNEEIITYPRRRLHDSAVRLIRNLLDEHIGKNYVMIDRPNKPMQAIHKAALEKTNPAV